MIDPERIIKKPKFHILQHIVEDVRHFGPSVLFSTEIFECYNAIFHACSIFSNHHAPSCDISLKFGNMYRFKHIASGGWWLDDATQRWVRAGHDIRQFFLKHGRIQEYLGWIDPECTKPGQSHIHSRLTCVLHCSTECDRIHPTAPEKITHTLMEGFICCPRHPYVCPWPVQHRSCSPSNKISTHRQYSLSLLGYCEDRQFCGCGQPW